MVWRVDTICQSNKLKLRLRRCDNQDVEVYIMFKGERLPICHKCWGKIATMPFDWGSSK